MYLSTTFNQIERLSINYVRVHSIDRLYNFKNIIQNKLEVVDSNLKVLIDLTRIKNQTLAAISILNKAQSTTNDLISSYSWFNENDELLWSTLSSENQTAYKQYAHYKASKTSFFTNPKETFKPYVTNTFIDQNNSNASTFIISYPVLESKIDNKDAVINGTSNSNFNIFSKNFDILNYSKLLSLSSSNENMSINYLKSHFIFKGIITATIDNDKFSGFINKSIVNFDSTPHVGAQYLPTLISPLLPSNFDYL